MGLSVIAFALVVAGAVVQAQQPEKIRRIGFLSTGVPGSSRGIEPFKRELRQLGYIEGKNIAFEYRYADGKPARLTALADELVRLNIDVIVAGGGVTLVINLKTAKQIGLTIPPNVLARADRVIK